MSFSHTATSRRILSVLSAPHPAPTVILLPPPLPPPVAFPLLLTVCMLDDLTQNYSISLSYFSDDKHLYDMRAYTPSCILPPSSLCAACCCYVGVLLMLCV